MIYTEEDIREGLHILKVSMCEHEDIKRNLQCMRPEGHQGNHMSTLEWWDNKKP